MLRMDSLCSVCSILFRHSAFASFIAFLLSFNWVTAIYSPAIATASSSCVLLRWLPDSLLLSMSSSFCLSLYLLFVCAYAFAFFIYLLLLRHLDSSTTYCSCNLVVTAMCHSTTQNLSFIQNSKYSKQFFKTRAPTGPDQSFLTHPQVNHKSLFLSPSPCWTPCPVLAVFLQHVVQTRAPTLGLC